MVPCRACGPNGGPNEWCHARLLVGYDGESGMEVLFAN